MARPLRHWGCLSALDLPSPSLGTAGRPALSPPSCPSSPETLQADDSLYELHGGQHPGKRLDLGRPPSGVTDLLRASPALVAPVIQPKWEWGCACDWLVLWGWGGVNYYFFGHDLLPLPFFF